MGKMLLILIFIIALILLLYYVILLITGKRIASHIRSKDRYIWRGLRNISSPDMPFSKKINTIFLDQDNLVITNQGIFSIHSELKSTGGLEDAVAIPLHKIVSFDYKRRVADWNVVARFFLSVLNHLLKVNDFNLFIRFVDEDQEIKEFKFRATGLDVNDFEVAFADFDNEIYSGKVKWDASNHGDVAVAAVAEDTPIFVAEDVPEKKKKKEKQKKQLDTILDEPADATLMLDEPVVAEESVVGVEKEPEDLREDADMTINIKDHMPVIETEDVPFEEPTETLSAEEVLDDDLDQTVSISQEEFLQSVVKNDKKDVTFERPKNYNEKDNI